MTELEGLSAKILLVRVFEALRASQIAFVVLRNYEELPEKWGNDVDILVSQDDLQQAYAKVLNVFIDAASQNSIQVLRRLNYRAAKIECPDRYLHVDLYSSLNKGWIKYADDKELLTNRATKTNLFDVPKKSHELLLIAAKELFSYGEIRARYHERLSGHHFEWARNSAAKLFGKYLTESGQNLVAAALVDPSVKGRPSVQFKNIFQPGEALSWLHQRRNGWVALDYHGK